MPATTTAEPPRAAQKPNGQSPEIIHRHKTTLVVASPFNAAGREPDEEMLASVRAHGIIQPLLARPKDGTRIELIAGERRWKSALKLKLDEVPVIIRQANDTETIELQTIENEQRKDLSPIEQAEKYQQALNQYGKEGFTGEKGVERLAAKIGKGKSTIYEALKLVKLPAKVKEAVATAKLPASHAGLLGKLESAPTSVQESVVKKIVEKPRAHEWNARRDENGILSFRDSKELVDETLEGLKAAKRYEEKAIQFRNKGGKALAWDEDRQQQLLTADSYLQDFRGYVKDFLSKLKERPKQIMAPAPSLTGETRMVWREKDLVAALKKAGVKPKTFGGGGGSTTNYAKLERARAAREREKKAILAKIMEPLRAAAAKRNAKIPWALFISTVAGWKANEICRKRKWPAGYQDAEKVLKERLAKLPENQMASVVADLLIEQLTTSHTGGYQPGFVELAAFYGVDAKAIAKAEQKKEPPPDVRKIKGLTAAGRKRLSSLMKARWTARQNKKAKAKKK
jgi:ParB family transcriptional regulator, chromosome partitioning protein